MIEYSEIKRFDEKSQKHGRTSKGCDGQPTGLPSARPEGRAVGRSMEQRAEGLVALIVYTSIVTLLCLYGYLTVFILLLPEFFNMITSFFFIWLAYSVYKASLFFFKS